MIPFGSCKVSKSGLAVEEVVKGGIISKLAGIISLDARTGGGKTDRKRVSFSTGLDFVWCRGGTQGKARCARCKMHRDWADAEVCCCLGQVGLGHSARQCVTAVQ